MTLVLNGHNELYVQSVLPQLVFQMKLLKGVEG